MQLIKYRNQINEIFDDYSFSLQSLLRNLCQVFSEIFEQKKDSVAFHIHIEERDFICKGNMGTNLLAKIEAKRNNSKGVLEIWSSRTLDELFEDEQEREEFLQLIDDVVQIAEQHNLRQDIALKSKIELPESQDEKLKLSFYDKLKETKLKEYESQNYYERDTSFEMMKFKVKEVMLIATLYDAFSIESEGNVSNQIFGQYSQFNLTSPPRITAVSSYRDAYSYLKQRHFDLIIIMVGIDRVTPVKIAKKLRENFSAIPIYFLLNNNAEINYFVPFKYEGLVDNIFVWNGDSRVFLAMIKLLEDKINVENDTKIGGVRLILLVEDSPRYYSRYLPVLYTNVFQQIQRVINEVVTKDEASKIYALRMRPKILLATTYEEAISIFEKYKKYFLSLITDVEFIKEGKKDSRAGFDLARYIRKKLEDIKIPIIIQSSEEKFRRMALEKDYLFINKNSYTLADDINHVIKYHMGFGDFIFRDKQGREIGYRARNLDEFIELIKDSNKIPNESIEYHGRRNHFSLWLMAQGEIKVAAELLQVRVEDFANADEIREFLIDLTQRMKDIKNRGKIVNFVENELTNPSTIVSLDSGSLGGKGRGIAFIHSLIYRIGISDLIEGIKLKTPATFIIGTDQYDKFLEKNNLKKLAFDPNTDYETLKRAFLKARLTDDLYRRLKILLHHIHKPLAIRSSGLLEDSLYQPFAGIYETYIVPNSSKDFKKRVHDLVSAIKMVYASVFSPKARSYINSINYNIEEEKMAIVIQEVVGKRFGDYYYPHISGVAQSYNYYAFSNIKPEDGYATIALGLGIYVVEGEKAYHFCPKYPKHQNYRLKDLIENSQTYFYAVDLRPKNIDFLEGENAGLAKLDIWEAERHGSLNHLASVYDPIGERLIPGTDASGPRVLDFADILKYNYIPLASTLTTLLDIAREAMGSPVEIEFAIDLTKDDDNEASFYLLQIKPLLGSVEDFDIDLDKIDKNKLLLYTDRSMGNGKIDYLRYVLYVDPELFNKSRTEEIAEEVGQINDFMQSKGWQYILIGPGRWGTRDKWIGIPVHWGQISQAKIIVETSLRNFPLEGSSGSHFFHNVISMNIGYFTVYQENKEHILRWDILAKQKVIMQKNYVKLVEFPKPLIVKMDGKKRIAIIELE